MLIFHSKLHNKRIERKHLAQIYLERDAHNELVGISNGSGHQFDGDELKHVINLYINIWRSHQQFVSEIKSCQKHHHLFWLSIQMNLMALFEL